MSSTSPKPTITELEANWNVHLAGLRAEQEARKKGMSTLDGITLLDAAVGGKIIGGILFPPIHAAFMLMMAQVEPLAANNPALDTEMGNMAALALILHSPDKAWPMLREGHAALFAVAVTEFAMQFDLADLKELTAWINEEMTKLNSKGEAAGKSPAE